jgi:hypothetical protein
MCWTAKYDYRVAGYELRVAEKMNIERPTSNIEWKTKKTLTFGDEGCELRVHPVSSNQ